MLAIWSSPLRWLGVEAERSRSVVRVRELVRVAALVRGGGLVVAGILGVVVRPRLSMVLIAVILSVAIYTLWSRQAVGGADDRGVIRIARTVVLLDELSCLIFLAALAPMPGGSQSTLYVPVMVEAMAVDGTAGAVESFVVFVVGVAGLQGVGAALFRVPFSWSLVLAWSLVMLVVAAALGGAELAMHASPERMPSTPDGGSIHGQDGQAIHLSPREREVLQLVAAGHSNAVIAARLHVSRSTVNTHVENLRMRLGAHNKAEAVATASRLNLI